MPVAIHPSAEIAAGTRQLVLDAAARLFRTQGYASTSLREIAALAGMRAASLYHYFDSRDAIVAEVLRLGVEQVFDDVRHAVDALPADADALALLQTAVHAHLQAMMERQDYTSANVRIFGQVPQGVRDAHLPLRDAYERYWASLLARCAAAGGFDRRRDLRLARLFLITVMNGSLEWFQGGTLALKAVADELTELMLYGLQQRWPPAAGKP